MSAQAMTLEEEVMHDVCASVEKRVGISFGPRQHSMVQGRLKRRIFELRLDGFASYKKYLSENAKEYDVLVSLLTTHHSYFFREFMQFEFLEENLASLAQRARARGASRLEILSAACSRGQEVYSIAMHLQKHLPEAAPHMGFRVFGSDVDAESIKVATNGVYRYDEIKTVPLVYMDKHWSRGTKEISDFVRAKNSIRDNCQFSVMNLFEPKELEGKKFDVIFCRNVFIYFSPQQIKTVVNSLLSHLHPGGILFLGLSESLHGMDVPIKVLGPSVYTLPDSETKEERKAPAVARVIEMPKQLVRAPAPLRVVCIDDSNSILDIFKNILRKEEGYELVGTATNGDDGYKLIQQLKPDVVTLDIHMPVCDGIEFLKKYPLHPPVVVVSSVARESANLAFEVLQLGAADYVEKPALNNLTQRADEIKAKLKSAHRGRNSAPVLSALDQEFARKLVVGAPEKKACVILFSLGDQEKAYQLVKEMKPMKAPIFLTVEGTDAVLPELCNRFAKQTNMPATLWSAETKIASDMLYVGSWAKVAGAFPENKFEKISILVLGDASQHAGRELGAFSDAQLLLEDLGGGTGTQAFAEIASDIVPYTSFSYLAAEFFSSKAKKVG